MLFHIPQSSKEAKKAWQKREKVKGRKKKVRNEHKSNMKP